MKNKAKFGIASIAVIVITLVLMCGCVEEETQTPVVENEDAVDLALPENRSFYMGMTPMPHEFTFEAVDETYEILNEHTDLVLHHFDDGIPWPEALAGEPYHPNVERDLDNRVSHLRVGQKVYLAITPLALDRRSLGDYWGEKSNMGKPDEWKNRDFDDPDVILAYTNYCRDMIQRFNPDYMAYGIEVDSEFSEEDPSFAKLLILMEQVYGTLKSENPDLPIFLTLQTGSSVTDEEGQRKVDERLLGFSDYVAISTYPYWVPSIGGYMEYENPDDLPADWFSRMADLAPGKPFAVAETGYIAEDLVMKKYGVNIKGREAWQAEYAKILLNESNNLNAEFIVWFVPRDYDRGWEQLESMGWEVFFKTWRDTGLVDGNGNPRLSLRIWDAWLGLPKR